MLSVAKRKEILQVCGQFLTPSRLPLLLQVFLVSHLGYRRADRRLRTDFFLHPKQSISSVGQISMAKCEGQHLSALK